MGELASFLAFFSGKLFSLFFFFFNPTSKDVNPPDELVTNWHQDLLQDNKHTMTYEDDSEAPSTLHLEVNFVLPHFLLGVK